MADEHSGVEGADWPPDSFADNPYILDWWLPADGDHLLQTLVDRYGWQWVNHFSDAAADAFPSSVIERWKQSDPLCAEYAHNNVLHNFAIARARRSATSPSLPPEKLCVLCEQPFRASDLPPYKVLSAVGLDNVPTCRDCITHALWGTGTPTDDRERVIAFLREFGELIGRTPRKSHLRNPPAPVPADAARFLAFLRVLKDSPTLESVTTLFGSWDAALVAAGLVGVNATTPPATHSGPRATTCTCQLPLTEEAAMQRAVPSSYAKEFPNFCATDGFVLCRTGDVTLGVTLLWRAWIRERPWITQGTMIQSGVVMSLATQLALHGHERHAKDLLSSYATLLTQTANERNAAARAFAVENAERLMAAIDVGELPHHERLLHLNNGQFWRPLEEAGFCDTRFVFVGGPMLYSEGTQKREANPEDDDFGASHASLHAMTRSPAWRLEAARIAIRLLANEERFSSTRPWIYAVGFFDAAARAATGQSGEKRKPNDRSIRPPRRGRWLHEVDPFPWIVQDSTRKWFAVASYPRILVWGWHDTSPLLLHATLKGLSTADAAPLTVLLPDTAVFRTFARRFVQRQTPITTVKRTFTDTGSYPYRFNACAAARFMASLAIDHDGTEHPGAVVMSALDLLDERYDLRISPWHMLQDRIMLSTLATRAHPEPDVTSWANAELEALEAQVAFARTQGTNVEEWEDRPYRPAILDAAS